MVRLINSAMMPCEGTYRLEEISKGTFIYVLQGAYAKNNLASYIGYQQNINLIEKWSGIRVAMNRKETILKDGDHLLIMKLNYRPEVMSKGLTVNEDDFSFYIANYKQNEKE